jgi:transposase
MTTPAANHQVIITAGAMVTVLFLAFELSTKGNWKLAFTVGPGQKPRIRDVPPRDFAAVQQEIVAAKERFKLPEDCRVVSCYEAGRDGSWLHRFLASIGVKNKVVDSSSIEVNRRKRQAKTDRLDATKLVTMLIRWFGGEEKVWSITQVPSEEDEDARQLERELTTLKGDQTRLINSIKGLLIAQGIHVKTIGKDFEQWLPKARRWNGTPIPKSLGVRILVKLERLKLVRDQISALEKERRKQLKEGTSKAATTARTLYRLKGIGETGSMVISTEMFAWRLFNNRKEVGSSVGLTGTPFQSGGSAREQGIDKAGIKQVRRIIVDIAWGWTRHQPDSALTLWFTERFADAGKRQRKKGIVGLARKLLIALWRWVDKGILPDGAVLKA